MEWLLWLFYIGPKGSGKTKWLIDKANEDIKDEMRILFL